MEGLFSRREEGEFEGVVGGGLDATLDSPAIRRLIEEVRAEESGVPRSYNRTFNRHNR